MHRIVYGYFKVGTALLAAVVVFAPAGCCPRRIGISRSVADSMSSDREVRYVERVRDTVIYVNVPAEVREAESRRDSSFLETTVAKSVARINGDGSLFHTLENKPRKEPVTVTVKDKTRNETVSAGSVRIERVEVPVPSPPTWMQKTLMGCGVAFVSLAAAAVVFFCLRVFLRRKR